MPDHFIPEPHREYRDNRRGTPWMAIFTVAAFIGGNAVQIVGGWFTNSSQLKQVVDSQTQLSRDFKDFMAGYNLSHEMVSGQLIKIEAEQQRIEDHLTHNDGRLDRIEARQQR